MHGRGPGVAPRFGIRSRAAGVGSCLATGRQLEHRDGPDASGLPLVLGEPGVTIGLFGVHAVALGAVQLTDGHVVGVDPAFDAALACGGEVVVPVGVCGGAPLGGEHVDDVVVGVVWQVHHRVDVL